MGRVHMVRKEGLTSLRLNTGRVLVKCYIGKLVAISPTSVTHRVISIYTPQLMEGKYNGVFGIPFRHANQSFAAIRCAMQFGSSINKRNGIVLVRYGC